MKPPTETTGASRFGDTGLATQSIGSPPSLSGAGLKSLVKVQRTRFMPDGTSSEENAYYLCSIPADAALFARCARAHWGVENSLHWILDRALNEDACAVKEKQAAENLSRLRKAALNLLKKEPSKGSMKLKRKKAAWDVAFLDTIFNPKTHA